MNKKLVLLGAAALLTAGTAFAQKRVTGRVVDTEGQPVVGASVRVEGGRGVVLTDDNGRFTLTNVPASAKKIKISYIGKESQTVSVAGNVSVTLADAENAFGEAVVVGYGSAQKIGSVVGSIKKVGSEVINGRPIVNVADALQGQVAGMQVLMNTGDVGDFSSDDALASIRIRGVGSLGASNAPLLVIDGQPAETNALSMLNQNDIESITTLKDASATSIYGSRAANGVLYIQTKKGRRGEKAQVTISQKIGWSQLARSIGNPMNADELLDFQLENGIITSSQYASYKASGHNTNWQDYAFDNAAPMYQTDFSLQGGNQNTTYYISASYLDQNGLTYDTGLKRYTLRSNIESKAFDWLTVGLNQGVTYTDRKRDGYTVGGAKNIRDWTLWSMMGSPYWYMDDEDYMIIGMNSYGSKWLIDMQPSKANDVIYNGSAFVNINPLRGLNLRSQLSLYALDTRAFSNVLPGFPTSGGVDPTSSSASSARRSMWTITNTAEYKFSIADKHHFTLLAGQEGIKFSNNAFGASAKGYTDDRLITLGNGTTPVLPSYSSAKYEYLSFFGRADYNFNDKYFFNFTVRNDQSSRFGRDNRSATFISGGALWNIGAEEFMLPLKGWLTDLRIKASVGTTGNSEIGNYSSLGITGNTQYDAQLGWILSQPSNTDLGWEKQIQTNVGLEASFFGKLHLDLNWYNRKTQDMLMDVPLPYTTGFSSQTINMGSMTNRGVEIELNYDAIRTRDAFLSFRVNYAYNTNKIDELFYGLKEWPMPNYLVNYIVGKSINFYMPIYAGVDKNDGAPMWYLPGHNGDPVHEFNPETMTKDASKIDDLAQDTGKKRYAPHNGGFGLTAGWKGLTLTADFAYVLGKYMVNNDYLFAASPQNAQSGFNQDKDMLHIWKKPGDLTDLPGFQYESQFDTHVLENASFLRLKNLTLSYDLPKQWMNATSLLSNVRLSFTGRNIFTVTKYRGADPEFDSNIARGTYPATRQYVLGLEVTF